MPLPETIPKRYNGIIKIQNDADWCLDALEELNMEDIPVPVPVSTPVYQKFEENNLNISLFVRMDSSLNYEVLSYDLYRGPDALEKFVNAIERELLEIQIDLSAPAKIIMEPGDYKVYNEATECWICKKAFNKPAPEILQQFEEAKHRLLECEECEICMNKEHPEMKDKLLAYLHPTSLSASQRILGNIRLWISVNLDF
ncbi:16198_t:CDS:2 [Acaulospora colombiana]|uniref:16198_t:CDS:1 n=1 Tax=Acaulospora colombiana TaxID=27376 RepID=A0ACA9K5G2_9GLOM|nr:16198_t:CDS:2 [Acaulospora colombiana]